MKTSLEERLALANEVYERRLEPEEFERRLTAARNPDADLERLEQMEWFCRRYPTAIERLRYVTQKARAWKRRR